MRGWKNGSNFKRACCSPRGPEFGPTPEFRSTSCGSHPLATPAPENQFLFLVSAVLAMRPRKCVAGWGWPWGLQRTADPDTDGVITHLPNPGSTQQCSGHPGWSCNVPWLSEADSTPRGKKKSSGNQLELGDLWRASLQIFTHGNFPALYNILLGSWWTE